MALGVTLLVLSLTVYTTAVVTKGPDQEPNSLIGIKTRATKSSKEAWVAAHRVAYPYMMAGATHCLASAALIVGMVSLATVPEPSMLLLSSSLTIGAVVILTIGGVKADRTARRHVRALRNN